MMEFYKINFYEMFSNIFLKVYYMQEEELEIVLFKIEELNRSLEILKQKCIEPFMDNNIDLEENRNLFTSYLFIKESFKTLNKLQILIKSI